MAATPSVTTFAKPGTYVVSSRVKTVYSVMIFIGLIAFAGALMTGRERAWHAFLVGAVFFLNIALGGLFWAAIQHVVKAGWSVNVRRIAEGFVSYLPVAAVTFIVLFFGLKDLYSWLDPVKAANDALISSKAAYLNLPFFLIRTVGFFGLWIFFGYLLVGNSLKQDKTGDENLTVRNLAISVVFLLIFALSYSLFSVDSLMSLEPHFFSTIWGVYCFAGLFQSFLAAYVIITIYLMNKGLLRGLVNENHLHDMAKFLKAFCVFYAYIAFSQFMLIWYANLPEETFFYLDRSAPGWMAATIALFALKFAVPFLLLLPRWAKRTPQHLVIISSLVLVMQYVDIHWMVYPNLNKENWMLGWQEVGTFLLFAGLFIASITRFFSRNPLTPLKDPRIDESVSHVVTY